MHPNINECMNIYKEQALHKININTKNSIEFIQNSDLITKQSMYVYYVMQHHDIKTYRKKQIIITSDTIKAKNKIYHKHRELIQILNAHIIKMSNEFEKKQIYSKHQIYDILNKISL